MAVIEDTYNKLLDYKKMSDKQLVVLIIDYTNEEAAIYLLYCKYDKDLRFYAIRYYNSLEYLEDLTDEVYLQFKGKDADWKPLRNFSWRCSFRTWYCSVVSHLFLEKRKELIGLSEKTNSIEENSARNTMIEQTSEQENQKMVIVLEAINRLENKDYRFILIKELEGFSPNEIAQLLTDKRKKEGRLSMRKGVISIPTSSYVYMIKARALKEVKTIVGQIQREWHEYNR